MKKYLIVLLVLFLFLSSALSKKAYCQAESWWEQEYVNAKVVIKIWPSEQVWWNITKGPLYIVTCFVGTKPDGSVETIIIKSLPLEIYIWSVNLPKTTTAP